MRIGKSLQVVQHWVCLYKMLRRQHDFMSLKFVMPVELYEVSMNGLAVVVEYDFKLTV